MTKHAAKRSPERKGSRSRQEAGDKIWAVGLAGATCVGLVGVVGVRAVDDAAAAEPQQVDLSTIAGKDSGAGQATQIATSSSGLTEEQLDEYSRALQVERMRLEAYHQELLDVAAQLQASADALAQAGSVSTVPASSKGSASSKSAKSSSSQQSSKNSGAAGDKATSKKSQSSQPSTAQPAAPAPAAPKPASKPVPKPAAAPNVAKPQAQTRGS